MTDIDNTPPDRPAPARSRSALAPLAAGATALGVCCGIPLLASFGAAGVLAGIGTGSWIVVAVASIVAIFALVRRRNQGSCATSPGLLHSQPTSVAVDASAPHRGGRR